MRLAASAQPARGCCFVGLNATRPSSRAQVAVVAHLNASLTELSTAKKIALRLKLVRWAAGVVKLCLRRYMEAIMDPALTWTLAVAVSTLCAASAAMKFADISEFAAAVENYRILPGMLVRPAAWMIPALEVLAALGLLLPATRAGACLLTAALLAIFTAAIAINLARGRRQIDCGCFGPALRQTLSGWLIARNAILLTAAAAVAAPAQVRPLGFADFVTIGFGAATLIVLYASMNYLLANAPWIRVLERFHA